MTITILQWICLVTLIVNAVYMFIAAILTNRFNVTKAKAWFMWNDGLAMLMFITSLAGAIILAFINYFIAK